MKAPDKIYLHEEDFARIYTQPSSTIDDDIEYIRKEAILEWLEQNSNQAQMWFDKYATYDDLAAKQVWEEVIDKLNEM
jgi:hypothetical protein